MFCVKYQLNFKEIMTMYKYFIGKVILVFFYTLPLFSDINLQEGVYDAAEEMMQFDKKMNELIAEHNQLDEEEKRAFAETNIEDFEETKGGYILKKNIADSSNTKVDVSLNNRTVTVSITKNTKEVLTIGTERSYESTTSRTSSSLYLPEDANENSMKKKYKNGILEVTFLKN